MRMKSFLDKNCTKYGIQNTKISMNMDKIVCIAYCIQNPGVKIRWIPLIISPEGIGKGALLRLIANIMGQRYVNEKI